MEIPVRLQLLDDDSNGVKLWVIARDRSNRAWYKWYENAGIAKIDAEHMRLLEIPVHYSPTPDHLALNTSRVLLNETTIREDVLETEWVRASNPPVMPITPENL